MKTLLIIASFFTLLSVNAQDHSAYLKFAFKADSAFARDNYGKCAEYYKMAFSKDSQNVQGNKYIYCASCLALEGKNDESIKYIYKGIKNGWVYFDETVNDADFEGLKKDSNAEWDKMIAYFKDYLKKYEASLSKASLRTELLKMYKEDQRLRENAVLTEEEYGKKSKKMKVLRDSIIALDSIHLISLNKILDEVGFPSFDEVGIDGVDAMFSLISHQHRHPELRAKALPLAKEELKKLGVPFSEVARLEDHVLQDQNKKQLYGTRIFRDKKGRMKIWPIEDLEHVNERRLKAEMRPIELYVSEVGLKMPKSTDEIPVQK